MRDAECAPAYTRLHWAKSDRNDPRRIHLLEHHLTDVGACFEALIAQPTIRARLARSGGRDSPRRRDGVTVGRLRRPSRHRQSERRLPGQNMEGGRPAG